MELYSFDLDDSVKEPIPRGVPFKVEFTAVYADPGETGTISLKSSTTGYRVVPSRIDVVAPSGSGGVFPVRDQMISIDGPSEGIVTIEADMDATDCIIVNVE